MKELYQKNQLKLLDKLVAKQLQINSFQLMEKAGNAIFQYIQFKRNVLVVTGVGNNAGDGFIIALLALHNKQNITLWSLVEINQLPTDAKKAANQFIAAGGTIIYNKPNGTYDCIVDAIFGTGLNRPITGVFYQAIKWMNQQSSIIALDIPSGLDANTGEILGISVLAQITISIICFKIGQFTNNGKDCCGDILLEDLGANKKDLQAVLSQMPLVTLLDESVINKNVFKRKHNSHKGSFGHAVIVGGFNQMLGAAILAAQSCLRSGCGIVEIISDSKQVNLIPLNYPELMTTNKWQSSRFIKSCQVIAIGPGLGLNQPAKDILVHCINQNKPLVIDADGLTLIADKYTFDGKAILTPHPKEAASLLNTDVASIQKDRVKAAQQISKKYHAIVVLKGSGTIIVDTNLDTYICPFGYSGMATAGMGDVLTGIIASLVAQNFSLIQAAITSVVWHAKAAQDCHKGRCLIATDVISQLADSV